VTSTDYLERIRHEFHDRVRFVRSVRGSTSWSRRSTTKTATSSSVHWSVLGHARRIHVAFPGEASQCTRRVYLTAAAAHSPEG